MLMPQQAEARQALYSNISFFKAEAQRLNISELIASSSAIQCVVIPSNNKVKQVAAHLQQHGYNIKPILSPTVPQGQERLRFCMNSYNTRQEISGVLTCLKAIL